mmetsp:Transcript_34940/g.85926  ORF Transcript_34940/g.85926 Transcript_34940/m.85926 type:complete len:82 (+) Transcript_34940:299-544(+)
MRGRSVPFAVKPFRILSEKEKLEAAKQRAQALQAQTQLLESNHPESLPDSLSACLDCGLDDADGCQPESGTERIINITRYL